MNRETQNRIFQALLAFLALWIMWEALRALGGSLTVILSTPPSDRAFLATVFVLAYGGVPGLATAACAAMAGALALRYPGRNSARSLALLCASLGVVFPELFFPTLFAELETFQIPLLPALPLGGLEATLTILLILLAPASFFWFSASFPDSPRTVPDSGFLRNLTRIQRWACLSPFALIIGALPLALLATARGLPQVALAAGLLYGFGFLSMWVTHKTVREPAPERSLVVAISLASPLLLFMITPLAELLPEFSPWFTFDVQVLAVALGLSIMALGLSYAIFVQGAVGPGLLIRKSLLYSVGGALGLFLFAGMESLVSDVVLQSLGLPSRLSTFVAAGAMAVGFTWARDRMAKRGRGAAQAEPS